MYRSGYFHVISLFIGTWADDSLSGCWLSDPLNRLFGRRGEIFITACVLVATPIGSAFTHSWQALFAVRCVLGLGLGAKNSTVPVSEMSRTTDMLS